MMLAIPVSSSMVSKTMPEAVAGRARVVVHRGQFYVGLRPQRYVGASGEEQGVDVITLDTKGVTVTQQTVDLQFLRREWYSVREKQTDGSYPPHSDADSLPNKQVTGAREHALAWKLAGEPGTDEVVVAPGSAAIAAEPRVRCLPGHPPQQK